jgi:P-type conjugative transfer protein TrbJ
MLELSRRGLLFGGASLAALAVVRPRSGHAQLAVICPTCDQVVTQLVQYALQAKQWITQQLQLVNEITTALSELQNLVAMPFQAYNTIVGDVAAIQNVANIGSLLAGNSGSIISRLNSISAAGGVLTGTAYQIGNLPNQMAMWANTLGNSASSLGNLVSTQRGLLAGYSATSSQIALDAAAADGNLKIAQTGLEAARNNGDILLHIATTDQAMAEALHTTNVIAADRKASDDAAWLDFLNPTNQPQTTGGAPLVFQ